MMTRSLALLLSLMALLFSACTTTTPVPTQVLPRDRMVPVPVDEATGYLPTRITLASDEVRVLKADVLIREKTYLQPATQLMVVQGDAYFVEQLRLLNRFDEVISLDELRQRVAAQGLAAQVGDLNDSESLKKAYLLYRPFLLLTAGVYSDQAMRRPTLNMEVLHPGAQSTQLFLARTHMSLLGGGSDQLVRRPLFNSLLDWIAVLERYSRNGSTDREEADEP